MIMPVYKREYFKKAIKKKPWYYCFHYQKQKYSKSGFVTMGEALIAEEMVRKLVILEQKPLAPSINLPFQELLPGYFANRSMTNAVGTVDREKSLIRQFLNHFGKKIPSKISIADIYWYIQQRKQNGISNRTINLELNLLRCIFKYAIHMRAAILNPAKEIKNMKKIRVEVKIPKHDEFLLFVKAASETRYGKQLVVWIWFRAYTATRERESLFVEWKDINFENNIIRIISKPNNQLKNNQIHNVIMVEELRNILLAWRQEWQETFKSNPPPHDWVFFNPNQKHKRAHGFRSAFIKAREKAGISFFTSKDLRHYALSHGMMSGISKDVLRRQAGQASTQMIEQTYGHLSPEYQAQEMKKFSFFHTNNSAKPDDTGKNSQSQEQPGSPEGAPKNKTGA